LEEVEGLDIAEVLKSLSNYRSAVRSAVRGLWAGNMSYDQFVYSMIRAIDSQYPMAWQEGARSVGILPDEMSPEERARLNEEMFSEYRFIDRFARAIIAGNKENGGHLTPLFGRAERWVAGYNRIVNIAVTYARSDPKLKWKIDAPKESCSSCVRLANRVKRASYWRAKGVYPKSWDKLHCRGGCKCSLVPTNEPASKGPLPNLP